MRTVAGGIYRVRVLVEGIAAVDPSWLVAAVSATWRPAEVVELTPLGSGRVDLLVRWSKGSGQIKEGDTISPLTEGLAVPQLPLPEATVEEVEPVALPPTMTTRSLEQPLGFVKNDLVKISIGIALIGVTAYLSRRIR